MNTINKKLTRLIAGRTIKQASKAENLLLIEFTDGSVMKIKSSDPAPACAGFQIALVKQHGTDFDFVSADDSVLKLTLAAETSSVMLRDKMGALEYAD